MDKETELWYENQFEMFSTKGWKDFINKTEELFEIYNEAEPIKSLEQLHKQQGMLEILRWVNSWETTVNKVYKDLTDQ